MDVTVPQSFCKESFSHVIYMNDWIDAVIGNTENNGGIYRKSNTEFELERLSKMQPRLRNTDVDENTSSKVNRFEFADQAIVLERPTRDNSRPFRE